MAGIAKDGSTPQERAARRSGVKTELAEAARECARAWKQIDEMSDADSGAFYIDVVMPAARRHDNAIRAERETRLTPLELAALDYADAQGRCESCRRTIREDDMPRREIAMEILERAEARLATAYDEYKRCVEEAHAELMKLA